MAIAYSTSNGTGTADGGALTEDSGSVVVPAGSLVIAFVGNSDGSPVDPSGVSLDPTGTPQTFTQVGTTQNIGAFGKFSCWVLHNASSVTASVRATWGSNQGERLVQAYVLTGAATSGAIGTPVTNSGATTSVSSGSVSTTSGDWVVTGSYRLDTLGSIDSFNSPSGTERIETSTISTPYDRQVIQDTTASGSSTTQTWTLSGAPDTGWSTISFIVNAPGGGSDTLLGQACL